MWPARSSRARSRPSATCLLNVAGKPSATKRPPAPPPDGGTEDVPSGPLILLDGMSLAFRAYFALPPDLATSKGVVTNAVHGFTSMVVNLVRDHHPVGPGRGLRPPRRDLPRRDRRGLQGRPVRHPTRPPAPVRNDPVRARVPGHTGGRGRGFRGGRRAGHAGHRGQGPQAPGDHRHRRPGRVPVGRGPLHPGALQPEGGERLRPLRRGRHRGADRGAAGEVPAAGRTARRSLRQPSRGSRRGGEDGRQTGQRVRRPRHHPRPPRRTVTEAPGQPGRPRRPGADQCRGDPTGAGRPPRCPCRPVDPRGLGRGRGQGNVRGVRAPHGVAQVLVPDGRRGLRSAERVGGRRWRPSGRSRFGRSLFRWGRRRAGRRPRGWSSRRDARVAGRARRGGADHDVGRPGGARADLRLGGGVDRQCGRPGPMVGGSGSIADRQPHPLVRSRARRSAGGHRPPRLRWRRPARACG